MATKLKVTEKEYKKAIKFIKDTKKYGVTISKNNIVNKTIKNFEKQNKYYNEYKKLNSKYNSLRYRVNKQSNDYETISGEFSNAPNPWKKKTDIGTIKYEGKKTIKNLESNIESIKNLWTENDLKVYGKDNNIKLLIKTALLNDKNYADFIGSEGWKVIKLDEEAHGGHKDSGYVSEFRITFMVDKIKQYVEYNSKLFGTPSTKKINKILEKELTNYDKEFPEDNLLKIFNKLVENGDI